MIIVPEGAEAPATSNELVIDDKKKATMVAKAKELMNGEPVEAGKLTELVEQFYVKENEHYTSSQLKMIISQVTEDLAPEEEPITL